MTVQTLELVNRLGLHARAAAKFVHTAGRFRSSITVEKDGEKVEAKSILGLLLLAAPVGSRIEITCDGPDETEAMAALAELIADRFGEGE